MTLLFLIGKAPFVILSAQRRIPGFPSALRSSRACFAVTDAPQNDHTTYSVVTVISETRHQCGELKNRITFALRIGLGCHPERAERK